MAVRGQDLYDAVYFGVRERGYNHVQATLAATQAVHETGGGTRVKGDNYFGIKGASSTGKSQTFSTRENENTRTTGRFAAYSGLDESIDHYIQQMERNWPDSWYAPDFETAAKNLEYGRLGVYATDQKNGRNVYADRLIAAEKRYDEPNRNARYAHNPVPAAQPLPPMEDTMSPYVGTPVPTRAPEYAAAPAPAPVSETLLGSTELTPSAARTDELSGGYNPQGSMALRDRELGSQSFRQVDQDSLADKIGRFAAAVDSVPAANVPVPEPAPRGDDGYVREASNNNYQTGDLGFIDTTPQSGSLQPLYDPNDPTASSRVQPGSEDRMAQTIQSYYGAGNMLHSGTGVAMPGINDAIGRDITPEGKPTTREGSGSQHFRGTAIDMDKRGLTDIQGQGLIASMAMNHLDSFGLGGNSYIHGDRRNVEFGKNRAVWDYSKGAKKNEFGVPIAEWDKYLSAGTLPPQVIDNLNEAGFFNNFPTPSTRPDPNWQPTVAGDPRLDRVPGSLPGLGASRPTAADDPKKDDFRSTRAGAFVSKVATPPQRGIGSLPAAKGLIGELAKIAVSAGTATNPSNLDGLRMDQGIPERTGAPIPDMGTLPDKISPRPGNATQMMFDPMNKGTRPGFINSAEADRYSRMPDPRASAYREMSPGDARVPVSAGTARTPAELGGLRMNSVPSGTRTNTQYMPSGVQPGLSAPVAPAPARSSAPPVSVGTATNPSNLGGINMGSGATALSPTARAAVAVGDDERGSQRAQVTSGLEARAPVPTPAPRAPANTPIPTPAPRSPLSVPVPTPAPRTSVSPRTGVPVPTPAPARPTQPTMTPSRAKALGMVETVPGKYMPNVKGNPLQVMADQAKLIAANPFASIAKMVAGTILGGVFHAGVGNIFGPNASQERTYTGSGNVGGGIGSLGGVGGSYNGPGGPGGYNGGGFQASPGGFGNYGSSGGFNSGLQSGSGFTYDR